MERKSKNVFLFTNGMIICAENPMISCETSKQVLQLAVNKIFWTFL